MTINTQKLSNGNYKVSINQGNCTSSCIMQDKAAALKKAMAGIWGLLNLFPERQNLTFGGLN